MSEFDVIAQDLLAKAQAEEQDQQARDRALLDSVLAIYGQKYVAEQLRKLGKNDWSRETLNRWVNGKCAPKSLTSSEEALLRKMLPSPLPTIPTMRSVLSIYSPVSAASDRVLTPSAASACSPASGTKTRCALTKPTGITTRRRTPLTATFGK